MSMTRKQFLGSFAAGIAGLGAMASGKVKCPTCLKTDCNHPTITSGYVRVGDEQSLARPWEGDTITISSSDSSLVRTVNKWVDMPTAEQYQKKRAWLRYSPNVAKIKSVNI